MRQVLLGRAPLGQGQGGGVAGADRHIGPPYYLLNDTFATDLAAGAVNGTLAEPGPGVRDVVDSGNTASITGGRFSVGSSAASFDPQIIYSGMTRLLGRMVMVEITTANTGNHVSVGWGQGGGSGTNFDHGLRIIQTSIIRVNLSAGTAVDVGAFATATSYIIAVIQRSAGAFYFIKGGAYTSWTLLYVESTGTTTPLRAGVFTVGTGRAWSSDYIKVPSARWVPTPLLSDGFSIYGESDGLGHAEGIAGGLDSGGDGVAWADAVGTWSVGGTPPTTSAGTLSGGLAVRTIDAGEADTIVTCKVDRQGGTAGIVVRWTDANNHVQLRHTGTNLQLVKVVAGSSTTLFDTAATYVANAPLRLICEGTKFRAFYNNAAHGGEQTISDAALQSATVVGLRTSDTTNKFDDFVVYARGSGGEYNDALDGLSGA